MDRLTQLRGETGGSRDSTLDTSSPPSEAYMTANDSSTSKFYSLTEDDSTFDISPIKDVSLASTADPEKTITETDELMSNLSPIPKKSDLLDSYKIGKQIEAANILSGGVDIFDDNDNSYDGDELVIDDNVDIDDKSNSELKLADTGLPYQKTEETETTLIDNETIASKDTEVVLQIDGRNVNAIDIGNGLYLYRKEGEEELAAVQIIDVDQQQPSFKFLKVRENAEGNLEVYEEIEVEVPKEVPAKEGKTVEKNASHVPIKDINKVISDPVCNKAAERKIQTTQKDQSPTKSTDETVSDVNLQDTKTEINLNGKMMKFSETRKSPFIHSTPNKEGIPLTKTMVDQQLHPNRHSDNVKTIEVHTDSIKPKVSDKQLKNKDSAEDTKSGAKEKEDNENSNNKLELTNKNLDQDLKVGNIPQENEKEDSKNKCNESPQGDKTTETMQNKEDISGKEKKNKEEEKCAESSKEQSKEIISEKEVIVHETSSKIDGKCDVVKIEDKANSKVSEILKEPEESKVAVTELKDCRSKGGKSDNETGIANIVSNNTDRKIIPSKNEEQLVIKEIKCTETPRNNESKEQEKTKCANESSSKINIDEVPKIDESNFIDNATTAIKKPNDIVNEIIPIKVTEKKSVDTVVTEVQQPMIEEKLKESSSQKEEIKISTESVPVKIPSSEPLVNPKEKLAESAAKPKEQNPSIQNPVRFKEIAPIDNKGKNKDLSAASQDSKKLKASHSNDHQLKPKEIATAIQYPAKITEVTSIPRPVKSQEPPVHYPVMVKQVSSIDHTTKSKEFSSMQHPLKLKDAVLIEPPVKLVDAKAGIIAKDTNPLIKINVDTTKKDIVKIDKPLETITTTQNKTDIKKEVVKISNNVEQKPINNNHGAVPFGKWTEANRQEFLNKIKEAKVPSNINPNTKQLKQPNDLNRRDILQKIDSQRSNNATVKANELATAQKLQVKSETKTFVSKQPVISKESKIVVKSETTAIKSNTVVNKKATKVEVSAKLPKESSHPTYTIASLPNTVFSTSTTITKKESVQRKEINNQDLIDKTIEDIINRPVSHKVIQEDVKQHPTSLDDIEMKMNELHGIPFVERPAHELPKPYNHDLKTYAIHESSKSVKVTKIPNLLPFSSKNQQKVTKENVEVDSEEEIIEHEPITGDIEVNKKDNAIKTTTQLSGNEATTTPLSTDTSKKESIITEKDFDKFARRNSITLENCFTVNFEGNQPHNVIQTVVEREPPVKKYSRNELLLAEAKVKSTNKHQALLNKNANKIHITSKLIPVNEDVFNKNHPTKLQMAYHSALTAKRQMESPITIIEDKPVKVVFVDSQSDYIPNQLNVQGKELSPVKKPESDFLTINTCDSMDSDMLEVIGDEKAQDESKSKTKHQRKQVLTPVETPELELIEPSDLGIELSPKKKRRTDDYKLDKSPKTLVPKKSYLLGRSAAIEEKSLPPQDSTKNPLKETVNQSNAVVSHKDAVSAIDSLVKAAELLDTTENLNTTVSSNNTDGQQNTPVKRGRGRPRKYPLPDESQDKNKVPTPQKKPRLIDAKRPKRDTGTEEEEDTSDGEVIKENWTMGKINENIVCPICHKLFRSENVVYKHVNHCPGPSPNRSDSDKRSPRRSRQSRESESKSAESKSEDMDIESETTVSKKDTSKKRKSKDFASETGVAKDDIILIEDSPSVEQLERNEPKQHESRKRTVKSNLSHRINNLSCEVCGKTFRQLSYLVSHKIQHKKDENVKKSENTASGDKSIFSCEVCNKEFRMLHHLVQHRIIHNPSTSSRSSRKSSSEQGDNKIAKEHSSSKESDDQSAAFRCEPCDKSFRKLHHLVEHRETHEQTDQKNNSTAPAIVDKTTLTPPPQCDICKKTFRKLHHLIEHKEQHNETSSEKSDDKSVKSALSTKDIIHECSLCYMVFPNEHSLNKHTVICQRKKRQSATKQVEVTEDAENTDENIEPSKQEESKLVEELQPVAEEIIETEKIELKIDDAPPRTVEEPPKIVEVKEQPLKIDTVKTVVPKSLPSKRDSVKSDDSNTKLSEIASEIPAKIKKIDEKPNEPEIVKINDTPKKKTPTKEKVAPTVTKRQKSTNLPLPVIDETPPAVVSSDDEEIRYMLNPDYKVEDNSEGKLFMKVRAKKRNSLQIERPNSKDLVMRRTSLQHPPKISRLKPKAVETGEASTSTAPLKNMPKTPKSEPVPSSDSEDSDIKYSFPKTVTEKPVKPAQESKTKEVKTPKEKRKKIVEKRKSLSGIAKRKSLGKKVTPKQKAPANPSLIKQIKRRIQDVEHRCDCGQLFSSAALLSRHATLAHTPPRIRRRRSPPPEIPSKTITKPATKPVTTTDKTKPTTDKKSNVKTEVPSKQTSRKSVPSKGEPKTPVRKSKEDKAEVKPTVSKSRRSIAHRGVPVPDKMRKLTEKSKK